MFFIVIVDRDQSRLLISSIRIASNSLIWLVRVDLTPVLNCRIDDGKDQFRFEKVDTRDATWFIATLVELEKITSSRGPDQQLQRKQRVYRQLGVQQALVLVQIEINLI